MRERLPPPCLFPVTGSSALMSRDIKGTGVLVPPKDKYTNQPVGTTSSGLYVTSYNNTLSTIKEEPPRRPSARKRKSALSCLIAFAIRYRPRLLLLKQARNCAAYNTETIHKHRCIVLLDLIKQVKENVRTKDRERRSEVETNKNTLDLLWFMAASQLRCGPQQDPHYFPDLISDLEYDDISDTTLNVIMSMEAPFNNSLDRLNKNSSRRTRASNRRRKERAQHTRSLSKINYSCCCPPQLFGNLDDVFGQHDPNIHKPPYLPDLISGLEYEEISDEILRIATSTAAAYNNSLDRLYYALPSTSDIPTADSRATRERRATTRYRRRRAKLFISATRRLPSATNDRQIITDYISSTTPRSIARRQAVERNRAFNERVNEINENQARDDTSPGCERNDDNAKAKPPPTHIHTQDKDSGGLQVSPLPLERPDAAYSCVRIVGKPSDLPPDKGESPTADAEELPPSEYLRRTIPPPHHERTSWVKRGSRSCDTAAVTFPSLADAPPDKGRHSARSTIGVGESPSIPTLSTPEDPANAVLGFETSRLAVRHALPLRTTCGEKNSSVSTPRDRERADYSLDGDSSREPAPAGTNQINPVI